RDCSHARHGRIVMKFTFRRLPCCLLVGIGMFLSATTAQALFIRPDLEKIPVDQLVKNLEMLADKNPKDAKYRLNLARAHAMAYALKTDTTEYNKRGGMANGAWFGYTPKHVPFIAKKPEDAAKEKAARAHLEKAIQRYEETVKLAPNDLTAQLGL